MKALADELQHRRRKHLYRARRVISSPQGPELVVDGRAMLVFCSNDYLGLANHPKVVAAFRQGAAEQGVGSGAAHLVTGHSTAHHLLEEELAHFVGRPRALLFSTGYMANLGVLSALAGRGDTIYGDRINHASLLDGALLSRAKLRRYPHNDTVSLEALLEKANAGKAVTERRLPRDWAARSRGECACESPRDQPVAGRSLIITDGVFSMDGDLALLPQLTEIARCHGAWLMVDDAHGLGVLGVEGRGCVNHFGLDLDQVPILVGTLGKALGTFGAFVAGSVELIETLIQQARSYIYTTALPPAVAEATRISLRIARREEWRRERLRQLIKRFRAGAEQLELPLLPSQTPIQPLIARSVHRALDWSRRLEHEGILISAIRPPTVPEGAARLRITFSACHNTAHVDRLLDALGRLPRQ